MWLRLKVLFIVKNPLEVNQYKCPLLAPSNPRDTRHGPQDLKHIESSYFLYASARDLHARCTCRPRRLFSWKLYQSCCAVVVEAAELIDLSETNFCCSNNGLKPVKGSLPTTKTMATFPCSICEASFARYVFSHKML